MNYYTDEDFIYVFLTPFELLLYTHSIYYPDKIDDDNDDDNDDNFYYNNSFYCLESFNS